MSTRSELLAAIRSAFEGPYAPVSTPGFDYELVPFQPYFGLVGVKAVSLVCEPRPVLLHRGVTPPAAKRLLQLGFRTETDGKTNRLVAPRTVQDMQPGVFCVEFVGEPARAAILVDDTKNDMLDAFVVAGRRFDARLPDGRVCQMENAIEAVHPMFATALYQEAQRLFTLHHVDRRQLNDSTYCQLVGLGPQSFPDNVPPSVRMRLAQSGGGVVPLICDRGAPSAPAPGSSVWLGPPSAEALRLLASARVRVLGGEAECMAVLPEHGIVLCVELPWDACAMGMVTLLFVRDAGELVLLTSFRAHEDAATPSFTRELRPSKAGPCEGHWYHAAMYYVYEHHRVFDQSVKSAT